MESLNEVEEPPPMLPISMRDERGPGELFLAPEPRSVRYKTCGILSLRGAPRFRRQLAERLPKH
jgi:hypothetical protein